MIGAHAPGTVDGKGSAGIIRQGAAGRITGLCAHRLETTPEPRQAPQPVATPSSTTEASTSPWVAIGRTAITTSTEHCQNGWMRAQLQGRAVDMIDLQVVG